MNQRYHQILNKGIISLLGMGLCLSQLAFVHAEQRSIETDETYPGAFSLACPFFTVFDDISSLDFFRLWNDGDDTQIGIKKIFLEADTLAALSTKFGDPKGGGISVWDRELVENPLGEKFDGSCLIVPTEELKPNWKRISIDGSSAPWDNDYNPKADLLSVYSSVPTENFDRTVTTRLLLTGTTALSRTVTYKMKMNGVLYPAEKIKGVFEDADLRHISNESSFWSLCPEPQLKVTGMQFCTPASYFAFFEDIGVNIVELTGNHLRDFDWPPLIETFQLLESAEIGYYGAGRTIAEAGQPYSVAHHGNQFVFLGCNIAGPEHVYVGDNLPGVNRCDFDQMEQEIRSLSDDGKIVVVTLQYYENYSHVPNDQQLIDFQRLSDAGAMIVSGSQAHMPQIMKPTAERWIHYGLGNLFFDQMDRPVEGTREEFLDRFIFYQGKLIQVELITAILEDYSQPRFMTADEREDFLTRMFSCIK